MSDIYVQYPQGGGGSSTGSSTGVPYSVGPLDGAAANSQGGTIGSFTFYQQSATQVFPGLVSSASQVFGGIKTFSNGIVSSVTGHASLDMPLVGGAFTGSVSMSSNKISNLLDPTTAQEAATKNYVDTQLAAFQPLEAVVAASASTNYPGILVGNVLTITATGAISVDGVTPNANDRILLKDQTTGAQNGVYVVTTVGSLGVSPVLTRAADYNTASAVNSGVSIPVLSGAINKLTSWIQIATVTTINVDSLSFAQFSANPQNVPVAIGVIDSVAVSVNGAVIGSSSLYLQSFSATNPGLVSSASQTFGGVKTFNSAPNLNSLSPSAQLALDGSRNIIVASVSLTANVTGVLPAANSSGLNLLSGSASLANQVSGILPVLNGGTGFSNTRHLIGSITFNQTAAGNTYSLNWPVSQGSASWVIQNDGSGNLTWAAVLSNPMTTSGDLIVSSGSGVASRLAIGSDGQILKADSTRPNGIGWSYPVSSVTAVNANYTVLKADSILTCSSFNYTITLYSASGCAGSKVSAINQGSTVCSITIITSSSQTINGSGLSVLLSTQFESYDFISDGSNWISTHNVPSNWTSYSPSNTGFGTLGSSSIFWKREQDEFVSKGYFTAGTPAAAAVSLTLPFGLTIDYSKTPVLPTQAQLVGWSGNLTTSGTPQSLSSSDKLPQLFLDGTSSQSVFWAFQGANSRYQKVNGNTIFTATDGVSFYFRIPVTGWRV